MATSNNTIKTRIQLKSDTEANWNKAGPKDGSLGFIPLRGEIIIYSADDTHAFSRLKVGDGETNVIALPFIDAGTLNGNETDIIKFPTKNDFPVTGSSQLLYVDLSTSRIYHYYNNTYTQLSNFNFTLETTPATNIINWLPGTITEVKLENNILKIENGILPTLSKENRLVVTNIVKEE